MITKITHDASCNSTVSMLACKPHLILVAAAAAAALAAATLLRRRRYLLAAVAATAARCRLLLFLCKPLQPVSDIK